MLRQLGSGDHRGLETTFSNLHAEARRTRDYSTLRHIYGELFQSPQRDRVRYAEDWWLAQPESLYANTAMAWVHHGRSFLYRDREVQSLVSEEGRRGFRREVEKATIALRRAHKADPDFPPALDAALLVAQTSGQVFGADPILDRLFEEAPDVFSLTRALNTYAMRWGHPAQRSRTV
ncbi:MAG: hypothetical protein AAGA87_00350 [Pseudomonadota bacterium]